MGPGPPLIKCITRINPTIFQLAWVPGARSRLDCWVWPFAVFGVSISILGIAIVQAGGTNFNQYVVLGVFASLVGVIVAAAGVIKGDAT